MVDIGTAIVGTILVLIAVGSLLYLFYSRTNAVEKTGYGALIMLAIVSLMIPIFWLVEGNQQTSAKSTQHSYAVQSGLKLYAQYCVLNCYTIKKDAQGKDQLVNPKYNGYSITALNAMTDDQIRSIISAGEYSPDAQAPSNPNNIVRSDRFGGPLTDNDIEYLLQFIRSADPAYLKTNGFTGDSAVNGFTQLIAYLNGSQPQAYQTAVALGSAGQFGKPVDMTKQTAITIDMVQTAANPGQQCDTGCYSILNVKVKVGTVITWLNKSNVTHTVSAMVGLNTGAPKVATQLFDSGLGTPIKTGSTFTYKVTVAAFTFNPQEHVVVYYCQYHSTYMFAELTIVQ